jgi:hypothetical protein
VCAVDDAPAGTGYVLDVVADGIAASSESLAVDDTAAGVEPAPVFTPGFAYAAEGGIKWDVIAAGTATSHGDCTVVTGPALNRLIALYDLDPDLYALAVAA